MSETVWQEVQKRKSMPTDEMIIDFEWQIKTGKTIHGGRFLAEELERLKQRYRRFREERNLTDEYVTRIMESQGKKEPDWLAMQR
jgi:hypothetical protein